MVMSKSSDPAFTNSTPINPPSKRTGSRQQALKGRSVAVAPNGSNVPGLPEPQDVGTGPATESADRSQAQAPQQVSTGDGVARDGAARIQTSQSASQISTQRRPPISVADGSVGLPTVKDVASFQASSHALSLTSRGDVGPASMNRSYSTSAHASSQPISGTQMPLKSVSTPAASINTSRNAQQQPAASKVGDFAHLLPMPQAASNMANSTAYAQNIQEQELPNRGDLNQTNSSIAPPRSREQVPLAVETTNNTEVGAGASAGQQIARPPQHILQAVPPTSSVVNSLALSNSHLQTQTQTQAQQPMTTFSSGGILPPSTFSDAPGVHQRLQFPATNQISGQTSRVGMPAKMYGEPQGRPAVSSGEGYNGMLPTRPYPQTINSSALNASINGRHGRVSARAYSGGGNENGNGNSGYGNGSVNNPFSSAPPMQFSSLNSIPTSTSTFPSKPNSSYSHGYNQAIGDHNFNHNRRNARQGLRGSLISALSATPYFWCIPFKKWFT